jgi:hypothetical protein
MKKKGMDGKFLDFPLCCLAYIADDKNKLNEIANYCVIGKALKMDHNYKIKGRIKDTDFSYMTAKDFDITQKFHLSIALASNNLGINLSSIEDATNSWLKINEFVNQYERKYGKDAYCRMGRQLTYEVIAGNLPLRIYLVLAAIHAILGKRNSFLRITYERIAYCMKGFKRKEIATKENPNLKLLSDRQIGTCVDKLREKNLIRIFIYNRREKFYSTRIKYDDALMEFVAKKKIQQAEKKYNVRDREMSQQIKSQIRRIKLTGKPNTMYLNTDPNM